MEVCLESLTPKVTQGMNEELLKEFTAAEVEAALAQMHSRARRFLNVFLPTLMGYCAVGGM